MFGGAVRDFLCLNPVDLSPSCRLVVGPYSECFPAGLAELSSLAASLGYGRGESSTTRSRNLGADARKISDQAIAKITSVNWQGLWEKMGQQADDGTSDKSILPPAIKQRLDLSGLGEKLKGMMGGKQTPEVEAPAETVQPTAVSTPVDAPATEPPAEQTTEPISDTTVQPAPIAETAPRLKNLLLRCPRVKNQSLTQHL